MIVKYTRKLLAAATSLHIKALNAKVSVARTRFNQAAAARVAIARAALAASDRSHDAYMDYRRIQDEADKEITAIQGK